MVITTQADCGHLIGTSDMTKITINGVSLSAHAGANGAPLRPFITPGAGDYAERVAGHDRRRVRRFVGSNKRRCWWEA
jgi:hypothetical protein